MSSIDYYPSTFFEDTSIKDLISEEMGENPPLLDFSADSLSLDSLQPGDILISKEDWNFFKEKINSERRVSRLESGGLYRVYLVFKSPVGSDLFGVDLVNSNSTCPLLISDNWVSSSSERYYKISNEQTNYLLKYCVLSYLFASVKLENLINQDESLLQEAESTEETVPF